MGTRALTVFKTKEDGDEIAVLYRQFDGYPEEHGEDLKTACAAVKHNGIENAVVGIFARLVTKMGGEEKEWGNLYLYAPGTRDAGEEFIYTVYEAKDAPNGLQIDVESV